jgi:hypothetical protein
MLEVVPIRTDLQVRARPAKRNDRRLDELGERHGINGPIKRLREALDAD